jgi:hypothetical protein
MNTAPELDERTIAGVLAAGWDFRATSLRYAAVGFGSHHWVAVDAGGTKRFLTVDDLSRAEVGAGATFARLAAAFETARRLRDGGLEFVLAPLADRDGGVLRRLDDRFSLAVFEFLDGAAGRFGEYPSAEQRTRVRALVARLHAATHLVEGVAPREDFALAHRAALTAALAEVDRPWSASGPFAEPARRLLAELAPALTTRLAEYDRLVEEVRAQPEPWVITHGEPHPANVIWTATGPCLVDWDTARIAPAGRDLWQLVDPRRTDDDVAARLYRLQWGLADVAAYVSEFRRDHERTEDAMVSWGSLETTAFQLAAVG